MGAKLNEVRVDLDSVDSNVCSGERVSVSRNHAGAGPPPQCSAYAPAHRLTASPASSASRGVLGMPVFSGAREPLGAPQKKASGAVGQVAQNCVVDFSDLLLDFFVRDAIALIVSTRPSWSAILTRRWLTC